MRAGRIRKIINRAWPKAGRHHRIDLTNGVARPVRCRNGLAIAVSGSGAGVKKAAASRSGKFRDISLVELEGSQAGPIV